MRWKLVTRTALVTVMVLVGVCACSSPPDQLKLPLSPKSGPFATPLTDSLLDNAAAAEWVDGSETPLEPKAVKQVVWTQAAAPAGGGLKFGASGKPGPRYLRLGFTKAIPVGSVLVRGGGALSVLRPGAHSPGNLGDDSQWLPAQRLVGGQLSSAELDPSSYGLWILPAGTTTRALRFTHIAASSDPGYEGVLGGVYVLPDRMANLALQAAVVTSSNSAAAPLLIDDKHNNWGTWDNGPAYHHAVSSSAPEWIILAWPKPVTLRGLAALWAGFNAADVQTFTGDGAANPQSAPESNWQPVGGPFTLRNQYPRGLGVDWLDLGKTVTTRAIRLRITAVTDESHHPHLAGKTKDGTRVWLGELMALSPLGSALMAASVLPSTPSNSPLRSASSNVSNLSNNQNGSAASYAAPELHGAIAVPFTLENAGFVTLVIEDAKGNRVRNLVADTWFEAGKNTAWWDGSDDLGRDQDAADHGVYRIPTHFVAPGEYHVRGITHQQIDLRYEFSVYNPGHPPWETPDTKGGWLTNHAAPSAALFLPASQAPGDKPLVYLGSYISEGGAGLAWVDLDGNKQGGRGWIGGTWTGAPYLARDSGTQANREAYAYVAAAWNDDAHKDPQHVTGVIRVTEITAHGDKSLLNYPLDPGATLTYNPNGKARWVDQIGGLAVHDDVLVVSLTALNQLLFVDAASGKTLGIASLTAPRGLAFDAHGKLLALSGTKLIRYAALPPVASLNPSALPPPQVVVGTGLEEPMGITLDTAGNIYISDRGTSHQVKVFNSAGATLRTIGKPGLPKAGAYDPLRMNNPRGMTVDSKQHLWVAEEDFQPKRVSVWTLDGQFVKAFYGPAQYGGGGVLDSEDKSRFYYDGMQFHLDWSTGKDTLTSIYFRPEKTDVPLPANSIPETALYHDGHRYFTNTYTGNGTRGVDVATIFSDVGGIAHLVAAMGRANAWDALKSPEFKSRWPAGVDLASKSGDNSAIFTWSDTNGNGKVDPDEVVFLKAATGWITVMPDLSIVDAFVDGKTIRYPVKAFSTEKVPVYDLQQGLTIADGAQKAVADGDGQDLYSPSNTVMTTAPLPFARESLGGIDAQGHRWSYPNLWPGLHPSHSAPVPDRLGEMAGTTRLLGGFVTPPGSDAGAIWGINGNSGEAYLFTADGLFLTRLFQDLRTGKPWSMPRADRNMLLNDVSLNGENFFPSITQTPDGKIYLVDGIRTSIVRIDGLSTTRRIPVSTLQITAEELKQARLGLDANEALRQSAVGVKSLPVVLRKGSAPPLENVLADASGNSGNAVWATVDQRTTTVAWSHPADLVESSVFIAGDRLFAIYRSSDANLLANSGAVENAPFKTGGALDLMIGTNSAADPARSSPVAGDIRLLVYQVNGKPQATLYRAVVPGTKNPVPFSSPDRTITLDQVEDVSTQLQFRAQNGNYALSIPLSTLGLKPVAGSRIKADIGILRGNGTQTVQRVYWNNKATTITQDVPSEAQLTPNLWGDWNFQAAP